MGIRANASVSAIGRFDPGLVRPKSSGQNDVNLPGTGPAPVIATALRGMIRSQQEDLRNANDSVALVHTAEGWIDRIGSALARLGELATLPDGGVGNAEAHALIADIDRMSASAEVGGIHLLDGSARALRVPVAGGPPDGAFIEVALTDASPVALGLAALELGPGALPAIDEAIGRIAATRSGLTGAAELLTEDIRGVARGDAPIRDADEADRVAARTRDRILADPTARLEARADLEPDRADAAFALLVA
jgi:flagellin-like hook-associated protein FlgL